MILSNKKHCRKNIFYRKLDPADHKRRKAALPERPPSEEFPISEPLEGAIAQGVRLQFVEACAADFTAKDATAREEAA